MKVLDIFKKIGNVITSFAKKIWPYIEKTIKWLFSDIKNLLIIVLAIIVIILFFNYKSVKHDYDNAIIENSLTKDSLAVYKTKNDELYVMNTAYVTDIKNLKQSNTELYNQVKSIKDKVITVEKINYVIQTDTIYMESPVYRDSLGNLYVSTLKYHDDWSDISGYTEFNMSKMINKTTLDNISFNGNIYSNIIERDGRLYVIANSDNPYFRINNLDGCILSIEDSKVLKKKYNRPWGISAGVGASVAVIDNTVKVVPALQVTVGYQFIRF